MKRRSSRKSAGLWSDVKLGFGTMDRHRYGSRLSLVFIDGTIVAIALPEIQRAFTRARSTHSGSSRLYARPWRADAAVRALGDRYGRKLLFVTGVVVFAIGSILCGLAPSMPALIAARVLQGAGGTMFAPASLALIGASFEGAARTGHRYLVGLDGGRQCDRSGRRRNDRGSSWVALGVLRQRAARDRDRCGLVAPPAREPRRSRRADRSIFWARRSSRSHWPASCMRLSPAA